MKKNVLLIAVALLGTLSTYAQVKLGVKAGFSAASINATADGKSDNEGRKILPAFHAGLIADFTLAENFSLQPGLFYSAKGVKASSEASAGGVSAKETMTVKLNYLEIPVNFLYKHEMGGGKLFAGFGPYIAFGIGGKVKSTYEVNGQKQSNETKVKFDGKKDANDGNVHMKTLDAGANFTVGYELKGGFLVGVNYSLGLTNCTVAENSTSKNRYFGISVGYLLGKKK
ncbi:outer membrane protein with beta-barrel domain [Chitinophaga niastensis]|uniref:Outer membrane protein with beta-barrel domain n=1 Tax=Chitinophaga niastensis TaxID=536980 RepID=A0A2P8HSH4_CHINA|nr:porin family protein [Chitinophaga niastensis]PSL49181.1 outer membrane protein with beta-barrel domain [Chitinophaga niastensis]